MDAVASEGGFGRADGAEDLSTIDREGVVGFEEWDFASVGVCGFDLEEELAGAFVLLAELDAGDFEGGWLGG